jgi:hypothetical protein
MKILKRIRSQAMPKVSIILPLYNSKKFIKECLDCLLRQSFKDYELIILDDCSLDQTRSILNERGLFYYKNNFNLGFVKNLNKGIKIAKGEYIMIADHDMVYEKDYIKEMLSKEEDITSCKCYYYKDKNKIRSFGVNINLFTGKTKVTGRDETDHGQLNKVTNIKSAAAGTLIIKRKVIEKIGLFDESFDKYYADIDFCLRARNAGFKISLSNAKCWHKKEEIEFFNKSQLNKYYQDKKLFLKKHAYCYYFSLLMIKIKQVLDK